MVKKNSGLKMFLVFQTLSGPALFDAVRFGCTGR